jgi:uncharacterized protein
VNIEEKFAALREKIRGLGGAAVGFSAGADSTLLCRVARDVLGEAAIAVTVVSPLLPGSEVRAARELATAVGIRHLLVEVPLLDEKIGENPPDRCYYCKKIHFTALKKTAAENGIANVLDGSNADDAFDYRPGSAALEELGVMSPLRDAGLTKAEVRALSKRLGLPTWDKPAFACLASRVPYGERVTAEKLGRIGDAEEYLRGLGLRQVRVRVHGEIARIEVAPEERTRLYDAGRMDETARRLKSLGFTYVCMDLEGYRTGSMNEAIGKRAAPEGDELHG